MKRWNLKMRFADKIFALILFTALLSIALVASSLTYLAINNYKQGLTTSLIEKSNLVAYNTASVLTFEDEIGARNILSAFKTNANIMHAALFTHPLNSKPVLLAAYDYQHKDYRNTQLNFSAYIDTPIFKGNELHFAKPISIDDEVVGYLYLHANLTQLESYIKKSIGITFAVIVISLIAAMVLALKYQRILLKPLNCLINTTQQIRANKDYAIRANQDSNDEFSALAENFNHMLTEIQNQDLKQKAVETEIRQLNLHLEDIVKERTQALATSNTSLQTALENLQNSQDQLVEQETMASLGKLVAGVAHEVNTPVGIGVTAVSHLEEITAKLKQTFENKKLTAGELEHFINNCSESIDVITKSLNKAAELVRSFKQVAVDQSSDDERPTHLKQHINDILTTLRPKLKQTEHRIHVKVTDETVVTNAGALYQIITNMVINSILHGFENIKQGNIYINLQVIDNHVLLNYKDDGAGIETDALKKHFEPFYTTKRLAGGTGLGSHIIYNLVTQALHGSIKATSLGNQGLEYNIKFPITKPTTKLNILTKDCSVNS
ncbi:sensor histidine kinase [Algibacillus agarilyticus]|uniref:sensor histidine kinase n=1 Tax=Algibacillus agarilyticus TaxID=2234133 RepID=UPI000DCFE4E2|nr:ATP-binding protein [Algibacillus agarilyticus]